MEHNKEQDIEKVKLFVRGKLTGRKLDKFNKRLKSDGELQKRVESYQLLMEVAELYSQDMDFRAMVAEVHNEYVENITYSYEELFRYFTPNQEFAQAASVARTTRKGKKVVSLKEIKVKKPINKQAIKHELKFQLTKKYNFKLLLTIFDNEGNRITIGNENVDKKVALEDGGKDIIIAKNTKKFSLLLKGLRPGIYYWRVKPKSRKKEAKYEFTVRSFYIQKNLMPDKLPDSEESS